MKIRTNYKSVDMLYILIITYVLIAISALVATQYFGYSRDYNSYIYIFSSDRSIEPFWYIIRIFNSIFFNGQILVLFFLTTLLALSKKVIYFSSFTNSFLYIILFLISYLLSIFWMHEYTQFRAAFVISLTPIGVRLIKENKKAKYYLLCLFCMTIHYSSLILFPLYFFCHMKHSRNYVIVPGILLFIAFFFSKLLYQYDLIYDLIKRMNIPALTAVYYMKRGPVLEETYVLNPYYLGIYIILLLNYFLFIRNNKIDKSEDYLMIFKVTSYLLVLFYLMLNTPFSTVAFRFAQFFLMYFLMLLIYPITYIKEKFSILFLL